MGLYGRQLAEAGRGYLRWTRARVPPEGPGESSTGAKAGVETVGGRQATRSSSRQIPRGTVPGMWLVWYLSTWLEELTPVRKPRDGEFICLAPNTLVPSRNYAFSPLGDAWPFFFFFQEASNGRDLSTALGIATTKQYMAVAWVLALQSKLQQFVVANC